MGDKTNLLAADPYSEFLRNVHDIVRESVVSNERLFLDIFAVNDVREEVERFKRTPFAQKAERDQKLKIRETIDARDVLYGIRMMDTHGSSSQMQPAGITAHHSERPVLNPLLNHHLPQVISRLFPSQYIDFNVQYVDSAHVGI